MVDFPTSADGSSWDGSPVGKSMTLGRTQLDALFEGHAQLLAWLTEKAGPLQGLSASDYGRVLQVSPQGTGLVLAGAPQSFRNQVINGSFEWWQRGTSRDSFDGHLADRWISLHRPGSGGSGSTSRGSFPIGQTEVPGNPTYFFRFTQAAGLSSPLPSFEQHVEDVTRLAGQVVTVSFWVRANTAMSLSYAYRQNFGAGGSAEVSGGLGSASVTTAWQRFTASVSLPGISGKTVGGANFLALQFDLPPGWTGYVDLACVQLERGPTATPFEQRPPGLELVLCQRYFCRSVAPDDTSHAALAGMACGIGATASDIGASIQYPVVMRTAPALTFYAVGTGTANAIRDLSTGVDVTGFSAETGPTGYRIYKPSGITIGGWYGWHHDATAEL